MTKPDICVKVIRMAFTVDSLSTQKLVRERQILNKNTLASLLQNSKNAYSITDDFIIHRVVLDLGLIPHQHFSIYFHQRLHSALVKLFIQLQAVARNAPLSAGEVMQHAKEDADVALVSHAIACLQPTALAPAGLLALTLAVRYQSLLRALNARSAATPALATSLTGVLDHSITALRSTQQEENRSGAIPTRLTPQHLAMLALRFLLLEGEGQRWLSQHSLTHEQRDALASAIVRRDIPVEQLLQCIAYLEPLPVAQARLIAGRWIIPLWRYPGMPQAVLQQAGKTVMRQNERYLASLLPGRIAMPVLMSETAENILATRSDQQAIDNAASQRGPDVAGRQIRPSADSLSTPGLPVANAGVILFWPLFTQWFTALGLMEEKHFLSDETRWQAVVAIDWLVWQQETPDAPRLVVNQFLCGLPLSEPPSSLAALPEDLQQRTLAWAAAVSQQLSAFEKMSLTDIRQLFLQRPGELFTDQIPAVLNVQPEPFDVLLTKWPWPLNLAYLPWFDVPLIIEWPGSEPAGVRL
ncbi:contractile injection system tape measure protein [Kosakonia sp. BYX6]|uniref:Contractile injection system tape measure protein n=1 Tax=Kosakonia calanthes TaxID=3139408 RepID=A0ABZ3B6Y1_9ENTR